MLVFMLGVMLPAAALIAVGVWHLRTIQREKSVEAVFQREYQQVLAIAEKRIDVVVGVRGLAEVLVDAAKQTGARAEFVALVRIGKFRTGFLGDLICARIDPLFGDS